MVKKWMWLVIITEACAMEKSGQGIWLVMCYGKSGSDNMIGYNSEKNFCSADCKLTLFFVIKVVKKKILTSCQLTIRSNSYKNVLFPDDWQLL